MTADAEMLVGVVIERRKIDNPWQEYAWRPAAVFVAPPHMGSGATSEAWRVLRSGEDWVHYHARNFSLELFKGETDGYQENLSQDVPSIFVALQPGEDAEDMEVEPFLATVCPYEAMEYFESGDEIVEGVPMPDDILAWVRAFVDEHHVDTPFKKRKNKRFEDRPQWSRPRGRFSERP